MPASQPAQPGSTQTRVMQQIRSLQLANVPPARTQLNNSQFSNLLNQRLADPTAPGIPGVSPLLASPTGATFNTASLPLAPISAAPNGAIRPVKQADVSEYQSAAEARQWGGSSCSAASLTSVLRAYGSQARVGDVVHALQSAGGITVSQGLVSRTALVATAERFGLAARDQSMTFDQLVATASRGPVLIDVTNATFPQGHWMVATGGDANGVSLADPSGRGINSMTRAELQSAWSGRGIALSRPNVALTHQESLHA